MAMLVTTTTTTTMIAIRSTLSKSATRAITTIQPIIRFHSTTKKSNDDTATIITNIPIEEARSKTTQALRMIGWDEEDAKLQADIMTSAELCGNNQGLVKMYQPKLMAPSAGASKPTIERETASSAVINGNQAPGMLAAVMAADLAASKVQKSDDDDDDKPTISIVVTNNTSTSSGQLGYYVQRMATQNNVIGLAMANSPEFVAAAPKSRPVFGTNPLAVSIPSLIQQQPFVFDMATSAIALFGVLTAKSKNEPLPHGVAYGKDGNWTTNAEEALGNGGAIATFGGHKGMGLSLTVELLAGALSGSGVLGQVSSKKEAKDWGHLFIAIRPEGLVDGYGEKVSSVLDAVRNSGEDVRIPGERSAEVELKRREEGVLPIPVKIWESILDTAENGLS